MAKVVFLWRRSLASTPGRFWRERYPLSNYKTVSDRGWRDRFLFMYKAYNTGERQTNKILDSPARTCAVDIQMATGLEKDWNIWLSLFWRLSAKPLSFAIHAHKNHQFCMKNLNSTNGTTFPTSKLKYIGWHKLQYYVNVFEFQKIFFGSGRQHSKKLYLNVCRRCG